MERLERYLDQVCRGVGGPRALRQHLRRELREHLLDAVAEHRAAGLSAEEAVDRALADFGGPEQVRSELEAAHGHRLTAVLIDKAMQWKERTMKATWLWASWAHLALAGVIGVQVLWITFAVIHLVPRFQRLMVDGVVDPAILDEHGLSWMVSFLRTLKVVAGEYATFWLLGAVAAVGLFEWRVRGENKSFMRLAALGTAAAGLATVSVLTAGAMIISFTMALPATAKLVRPFALQQVAAIDESVAAIELALAKKDWGAMSNPAAQVQSHLTGLIVAGPVIPALLKSSEPEVIDRMRAQVKEARAIFDRDVAKAKGEKDAAQMEAALKKFREKYRPVQDAARQEK